MVDYPKPQKTVPQWEAHRIVPSHFPPIDVFESVVSQEEFEIAAEIEGLTNDRLRDLTGDIERVPFEDRVFGAGSTPLMAAFTHLGAASRFTNGDYGVYYAASTLETAIRETVFHRERFLRATQDPPMELTMRCYISRVVLPVDDLRPAIYDALHNSDPAHYPISQRYAAERRQASSHGLLYRSVRHPKGECIAAFRPRTMGLPWQGPHLRYVWNGESITDTFRITRHRSL
ncbi:RES family NAD+ phosphorylase [Marinobacter fonticola]|uniref:RES family NAD+ phosphorylase n=1 Tax=Marinobacter fonticola TaxID=2603215 RepID=UPI0011E77DB2|nr:RES family NAD+ phosphorylase [Marinobacter fonticola]